jgi:hypothetical protein
MFDLLAPYFSRTEIIADLILLAFLVFAFWMPLFADKAFRTVEGFGTHVAQRKSFAIASIAFVAIIVRLALMPWLPVPTPKIHDEFGYLLAADTFAHGRLTNPTHAMWVFFDTIHVNQHPTYMSKYPPAAGMVLALGQLLGNPWIGAVLGAAGMCAAVLWMLQGWLPPRWALLGATLVLLRLSIFTYWMNSYWGGAISAIGGALVVGALPRILHRCRARDAIMLGLGAAVLANSRPFEGLILCLPVFAVLAVWLLRKNSSAWRVTLTRFVLPLGAVALLCGLFMAYYNWRGTGNPLLFPYVLNQRTYERTPAFVWQKAEPPLQYLNPQFDYFYNHWERDYWAYSRVYSLQTAIRHLRSIVPRFVRFFAWPELCVPLITLPWLFRSRRFQFLGAQAGLCFLGSYCVIWFLPHYAAPAVATVFALLTQSIRYLRHWQFKGRPVGIGLSRVVVLFAAVLAPFHQDRATIGFPPEDIEYRAGIVAQLNSLPGKQLVIVRYPETDDEISEWVFNGADIDHAKVVWAREIPGVSIKPLLDYFKDRRLWLVEPGILPVELESYSPPSPGPQ